jgi:D-alanyl-D-alanine carboxypeptidase (penicillin-binding protein 5/6)
MRTHNNILFFMLASVAITATLFFNANTNLNNLEKIKEERDKKIQAILENTPIIAKAISIYDITENRKIYSKNDDVPLPIASLAKIMTVVEGLRGHQMDDIIYVSPNAVKQAGDFGIFAYEKWKIGDLAKLTLVVSANDGAFALSEQGDTFLSNINSKVHRLGATNTIFANPTGLDIYEKNKKEPSGFGVVASTEDVNAMAMYGLRAYPEIFKATTLPEINLVSESGFPHTFKNTNILIGKIPNLLFSKTGFTDKAGGSLVIIFKDKNEHEIAVTVLGSTYEGRFSDMEKLVAVFYPYLTSP